MSDKIERIKTLIIGSGPAGYTAAIYAARADLKPVMYTGMEPGGQLTTTTEVDNFPGYADGVDGPKMMMDLQKQAERFGTEVRMGMVTEVEFSDKVGGIHKACVDNSKWVEAETIIISTGATAKYLGLPSEQRLRGGGVSACAVCDGFFYKGQDVAIVGGGDTAAEEATYLANICSKVTMLVRGDQMRASKAMQHRVNSTKNIDVFGVFIAIGHKPNTGLFEGQLDMKNGYIHIKGGTEGNATATNVPGIFAAGDVTSKINNPLMRQITTSTGLGTVAALSAIEYLQGLKIKG